MSTHPGAYRRNRGSKLIESCTDADGTTRRTLARSLPDGRGAYLLVSRYPDMMISSFTLYENWWRPWWRYYLPIPLRPLTRVHQHRRVRTSTREAAS